MNGIITPNDILVILTPEFYKEVKDITLSREKKRGELIEEHGDLGSFFSKCEIGVINRAKDPRFPAVFDSYDRIFTLPDEKTPFDGFEKFLASNTDPEITRRFGPAEEAWIYVLEPKSEKVIGSFNFDVFTIHKLGQEKGIDGTCQAIYLSVEPEYRNMGLGRRLLRLMGNYSKNFLDETGGEDALKARSSKKNILTFSEQNAPELMTLEEYLTDNIHGKIDQCDRLEWWNNRGYKQLDFRYMQPPTEKNSEPCTYLTLNVTAGNRSELENDVILSHLERFFFKSFLGEDTLNDEIYLKQKEELKSKPTTKLINKNYKALQKQINELVGRMMLKGESIPDQLLGEILGSYSKTFENINQQ